MALLSSCAPVRARIHSLTRERLPVLLVHGIDDGPGSFNAMRAALARSGWKDTEAVRLVPNHGEAHLDDLAVQVERAASDLLARTGEDRLELVGFSMGALVARAYLQRHGGKEHVHRFISISGPQHGTWMAKLRGGPGVEEMRPDSAFLRALEAQPDPFGAVELVCFYTPYDTTIVPRVSAVLPGAKVRTFPVWLHPLMPRDARVIDGVVEALDAK